MSSRVRTRHRHCFPFHTPERLEPRLSPSAMVSPYPTSPMPVDLGGTDPSPYPGFEIGDPPVAPPTSPVGPDMPA